METITYELAELATIPPFRRVFENEYDGGNGKKCDGSNEGEANPRTVFLSDVEHAKCLECRITAEKKHAGDEANRDDESRCQLDYFKRYFYRFSHGEVSKTECLFHYRKHGSI